MEALASVLCSAPAIRLGFVRELAKITRWEIPCDLEQCQIRLKTELVIRQAKRIDLTVEVFRRSESGPVPLAVWAFEAKVDSGLNESADWDEDGRIRSQLDFYSDWLKDACAEHKAGFVLGKGDLRVPVEHRKEWHRLTWMGVAEILKQAGNCLDNRDYERVLVESYYSFVRDYIGGVNMRGESDFRIDDVLFLRALESVGDTAAENFNSLVSNLEKCLQDSKLLTGEIKHQKALFGRNRRSVLWGTITEDYYPILMVGVRSAYHPVLFVVIETDPGHRHERTKTRVKSILADKVAELDERSLAMGYGRGSNWPETKWRVEPEQGNGWWDLEVNWPLELFLSADDQSDRVRRLVSDALKVLSESGVSEALRDV